MGFGILFIGYFLNLNFAYYQFTDAIAAIIMLYALYKLSYLNRGMKLAARVAMLYAVLGIFELAVAGLEMFYIIDHNALLYFISAVLRNMIIGVLTASMLYGMRDVAREVGLDALGERCRRLFSMTVVLYPVLALLECGELGDIIDVRVLVYASVIAIFLSLILTVLVLATIYSCYMRICMPGEESHETPEKRSKFGIVNALRDHQKMRAEEYAEYRLEKIKKRAEKAKEKQNVRKK